MKRYQSGTKAKEGIYLNVPSLQFASLEEAGGLPVVKKGDWVRIPDALLLLGAPLIGLAYVIFLPVIGFVMLARVVAEAVATVLVPALSPVTRVLRPAWQPALAFFGRGRRKTRKHEEEGKEPDKWAEESKAELRDSK